MGIVGNTIGDWIQGGGGQTAGRAIGGLFGDANTGASIGQALQKPLSWLARLLPFEQGGMVHYMDPRTGKIVKSVKKKAPKKKASKAKPKSKKSKK